MMASMKRVGDDAERLTRRNMKQCVTEHIQTKCLSEPAFARQVMHPRKTMIRCFRYITRKAQEFAKQEMEDNDEKPIVRVCKASVSYRDSDNPKVSVWENARFFIKADGKSLDSENYYYSYASEKLTPWTKGMRPSFNRWAYYFEADTCGHIYTQNLDKVLKGTPWQYCQLRDYYLSRRETMAVTPYLREYLRHPALEYLVKLVRVIHTRTAVTLQQAQFVLTILRSALSVVFTSCLLQ